MPTLTFQQLEGELRGRRVRPFYVVFGPEDLLVRRLVERIEDVTRAAEHSLSERFRFSGREATEEHVLSALSNFSLLGGRPLVIITQAEELSSAMLGALTTYAAKPVESSTLIVCGKKFDRRTKFMQVVVASACVVECKALYANQVPSWIVMEARRLEKEMSQEAARYVADLVGNTLGALSQTVEQLALFVGSRRVIELADVEKVVTHVAERSVFELTDAIGTRDLQKSFQLLRSLLDQNQAPVMILAMIARHMRLLVKAQAVATKDGASDAARILGVHPFFAKNYLEQSKSFSPDELKKSFHVLASGDRELKSVRLPGEQILAKVITELVRRAESTEKRAESRVASG